MAQGGKLKAGLAQDVAEVLDTSVPEIAYSLSQPIQMRTNELIAGIRSDVAVSIYGDDLGELRRLGEHTGDTLRRVPFVHDLKRDRRSIVGATRE